MDTEQKIMGHMESVIKEIFPNSKPQTAVKKEPGILPDEDIDRLMDSISSAISDAYRRGHDNGWRQGWESCKEAALAVLDKHGNG